MPYFEFLNELKEYAEPKFADFQRKLIFTDREILGVRTPKMRKLAKKYFSNIDEFLSYPNEYYETVFIKLTMVSLLPYARFVEALPSCIELMDNWALCDSFKAKCIRKNKEEFLTILEALFQTDGEYFQRYPLTVLLFEYVEEKYLHRIKEFILNADTSYYYVHMAVAWLLAEILIQYYDYGIAILKSGEIPAKTHNKAIQKARESFRLSKNQKEYLHSLKV